MNTIRAKLLLSWLLLAALFVTYAYSHLAAFLFFPILFWVRRGITDVAESRRCRQKLFVRIGIVVVSFLALRVWDVHFPLPELVGKIVLCGFAALFFSVLAYPDVLLFKSSHDKNA